MPASLVEGGHAQRCFYYVTSTHLTKADWTLGRTLPKPGQSDPLSHEYESTPSELEMESYYWATVSSSYWPLLKLPSSLTSV